MRELIKRLESLTEAKAPPAAAQKAADKWASTLSPGQRKTAAKLAAEIEKTGAISTGMFADFKKVNIPMGMERFLRISQLSSARAEEIKQQLVTILKSAAKTTAD